MDKWASYLEGGDLRSIGDVKNLIPLIQNQTDFDKLFKYLHSGDRLVMMRTADAIDKITMNKPEFLSKHKKDLVHFLTTAIDKEFKWHMALLIPRLILSAEELEETWDKLSIWAKDKEESKIVRVNSLQSLFNLARQHTEYKGEFQLISEQIKSENIPSITARLKKLEKE